MHATWGIVSWTQKSVKEMFVRGNNVRYISLSSKDVDAKMLQDASKKESDEVKRLALEEDDKHKSRKREKPDTEAPAGDFKIDTAKM